jgi:hypothetical protein
MVKQLENQIRDLQRELSEIQRDKAALRLQPCRGDSVATVLATLILLPTPQTKNAALLRIPELPIPENWPYRSLTPISDAIHLPGGKSRYRLRGWARWGSESG